MGATRQITKEKLQDLFLTINQILEKSQNGFKFNYALIKNKNIIESEYLKLNEQLRKLDLEREALCIKYCIKDEENNPVIIDKKYQGLERGKIKEFDTAIDILTEDSKNLLKEEIEFTPYIIDESWIPEKMFGKWFESILILMEG